jgi:hypothetical protein
MTPAGELEVRLTDLTDRQVIRGRLLGRGFLFVGRRPNAQVVLHDRIASSPPVLPIVQ